MLSERIGFIGSGQMATAMAQGWARAKLVPPENLVASDPVPEAREHFVHVTGGRATPENQQVVVESDVVILAVKPQQMASVAAGLQSPARADKLFVSIAAGTRMAAIAQALGDGARLVRVMPNTPCLVGQGAFGYCLGEAATDQDGRLVGELLSAIGVAYRVEEKLMDAITGLSGSGPAFVYVIIEAMADAGVKMGLTRQVALGLAAQTVRGAGEMVLSTGEHPGVLKDRVTSPAGTTITGLAAIEAGGLRTALISAVEAATRRSAELGAD